MEKEGNNGDKHESKLSIMKVPGRLLLKKNYE